MNRHDSVVCIAAGLASNPCCCAHSPQEIAMRARSIAAAISAEPEHVARAAGHTPGAKAKMRAAWTRRKAERAQRVAEKANKAADEAYQEFLRDSARGE